MVDSDLTWLVPVLRRPHRVRPLLEAIRATTPNAEVVFVADPDDREEHRAIRLARRDYPATVLVRAGGWAHKINEAVRVTDRPLLFLAADDLEPQPKWFDRAAAHISPTVHVVGVNDLIRRRRAHTTHFLMAREYALQPLLDGSRGPVCERYEHNFCDDELIATAKHRGAYVYAPEARVKHYHPYGGGGTDDDTYRKGRDAFHRDRRLFERRLKLWT